MIVYRDQHSPADPHRLLHQLESLASRSRISAPEHEDAVELIIQSGMLESAVVDAEPEAVLVEEPPVVVDDESLEVDEELLSELVPLEASMLSYEPLVSVHS